MKHTKERREQMSKDRKEWWANIKKNDPERYREICSKIGKASKDRDWATGDRVHNWKGGRRKDKRDGYILLHRPDHPDCRKDGSILEHRLVMEEKIGRRLDRRDDVNHINGIKDDNRPENLVIVKHHAHYEEMHCPECDHVFRVR